MTNTHIKLTPDDEVSPYLQPITEDPVIDHDQHIHHDPTQNELAQVHASEEFQKLRRRFRNFAFPMTAAFLIWFFAYVLLSTYAVSFMSIPVLGHLNIGLLMGLGQFATTFLITYLYIRHANKNLDPIATNLREALEKETAK